VNVLVCVKRVPAVAGKITLTADGRGIDTRHLAFTVSPHEECAAEEAVRLVAAQGGESTVLTLGPEAATEQLRDMMAIGVDRAVLLETDGAEWDPQATAAAIVEAVRAREAAGGPFELLLFGNEAADTGDYQVGIRVAHALDRPCVTGVKALEVRDGRVTARREASGGWEVFEAPLPAVLTVREGLNLPRYPSLPGRLKAKKKPIERVRPARREGGLAMVRLRAPAERGTRVEVLGQGADAAPRAVALLRSLGLLSR
jgi:electron transfer flavoprotein beta subunit